MQLQPFCDGDLENGYDRTISSFTMDPDRWNMPWSLKSKPSREQQEDENSKDAATSAALSNPNRYQHDMEQAMAMRKSMLGTSKNNSSTTEDDVRLGFVGLEEAEEQAKQGNLSEALRLYELAIELLILFLRDTKSPSTSPSNAAATTAGNNNNIDRTTVEARIQAALCEAEAVKPLLAAQKGRSGSSQQQLAAESTKESRRSPLTRGSSSSPSPPSSLTAALQSALRRGTAMVQGPQRPAINTRQSRKLLSKTRSYTTPTTRRATGAVPGAQYAGQLSTARPLTANKKTPPAPISPISPPNPQSDALIQIVETDLMVDPACLSPVSWDDIAGLATVKMSLQESAVLPMQRPDLFTGLRRPQHVLLYGPPGTGKTLLARAVARESGSTLFLCSAANLTSKWMGEAEKLVRCLFRVAQERAPSIVFLDELDALLSTRKSEEHEASRRLKTEFMVQMDGIHTQDTTQESTGSSVGGNSNATTSAIRHVLVLACTNCPWDIDSAVLRRFPRRILVPLPDEAARRGLLQHLLQKAGKHSLKSRDVSKLVDRTQGFSCSDISAIAVQASFGPLRALGGMKAVRSVRAQDVRPITLEDFESVINETTKSVSSEQLRRYDDWQRQQAAS